MDQLDELCLRDLQQQLEFDHHLNAHTRMKHLSINTPTHILMEVVTKTRGHRQDMKV